MEHNGQPPAQLVDMLLDLYARPDGSFLDVGGGAGPAHVGEVLP